MIFVVNVILNYLIKEDIKVIDLILFIIESGIDYFKLVVIYFISILGLRNDVRVFEMK